MNRLCIFGTSAILGYVGWFLAEPFGYGWAIVLSGIGSLFGVYVGWKIARHFSG